MKILKIRFRNINSLKEEHVIDFNNGPLSSAGLFAITGPTGSGKTTILDVISLALFSRIPRVSDLVTKGFIEKTGLVLTRNMKDALAEISYNCSEGTFTSQWSISTNRNGKLRNHEMQISDDSGKLIDLRKSEVPAKNESLIGLNFEQFVKAIILAQGDFAAFLKAKGDERSRLLEKVTGTWIYRELGKAAFQKNKEFGQELELLQSQVNSRTDQVMPEAAYQELLESINKSDQQIDHLQTQVEKFKGQEKLKNDISKLVTTIQENDKKFRASKENLDAFLKDHGQRMEKHGHLQPHRKELWEWHKQLSALEEQKGRLKEIRNALSECTKEDEAIKEEVQKLTGSTASVNDALAAFQGKVLALQRKLSESESLMRNIGQAVMEEADAQVIDLKGKDPVLAKDQIAKMIDDNRGKLESLAGQLSEEARNEPKKKLKELADVSSTLQSLISEAQRLGEKQKEYAEQKKEVKELKARIKLIPQELEETREKQKQAELKLQGLQKDKQIRDLTASLEKHRQRLVEGEPCPLCGSTEHPFSKGIESSQDDLDHKIDTASQDNEDLKGTKNKLESELSIGQKTLEKQEDKVLQLKTAVKDSSKKANKLRNDLPESYRLNEPAATLRQVKQEDGHVKSYEVQVQKRRELTSLAKKIKQWEDHFRSVALLSGELKNLFTGNDILAVTQDFRSRLSNNTIRWDNLKEENRKLFEKNRLAQKLFQDLSEQLANELSEYESPEAAMRDLMDDEEYARLQSSQDDLKQEINRIGAELKVHRGNLQSYIDKDVETPLEELEKMRAQTEDEIRQQKESRDSLKGKQNFQETTLKEIKLLKQDISEQKKQNEKWVILNKYIGDAEGKRFSTFAQELTLIQLLKKANKRLVLLNERYMLGLPTEDEDDSLAVIDTHMGNMRRSVKSLSGGETFLVSLSLALALSDLAAHKVEIKSLFIDEGFGSLDKVTLDQTMDTLEKLQYETNKTIGVISHVEAMQERITTQIKLEKGGQGYSTLTLC